MVETRIEKFVLIVTMFEDEELNADTDLAVIFHFASSVGSCRKKTQNQNQTNNELL